MRSQLPNFFIVGAVKGGTTSLYHYLKQHPEIYMSPVKELNYFSTDIDVSKFRKNYKRDLEMDLDAYLNGPMDKVIHLAFVREKEQYLKLFKNVREEKAIGEATTSYLYSNVAAKNISKEVPAAKIIISLRNPIERAFSHYLMDLAVGYTKLSFLEALKKDLSVREKGWGLSSLYIELGMYSGQVKRYFNLFPRENIKIYLYEDFKKDPEKIVKRLYQFLGVDVNFEPELNRKYNIEKIPKFKTLNYFIRNMWIPKRIKTIIYVLDTLFTHGSVNSFL